MADRKSPFHRRRACATATPAVEFGNPESLHENRKSLGALPIFISACLLFITNPAAADDSRPAYDSYLVASVDSYGTAITSTPDSSSPSGVYIPRDLDDALVELKGMLPDTIIAAIRHAREQDVSAYLHFGLGRWIRNFWIYPQSSRLAQHLFALGLRHPDDMSGIIITSLCRNLQSRPIELDAQVREYQAYWDRQRRQ